MTELDIAIAQEEFRAMLTEVISKIDESADRAPRLLNEHKTAKYLDVSPGTLRNWREKNIGPRCLELDGAMGNKPKKLIRYDIVDLDKWATEHPRRKESAA